MSARVGKAGFLGEAAFGLVASLVAAAVALTLSFVAPQAAVLRLVIAGFGLALVLRAMSRSAEKTGRVVTLVLWVAVVAGVWLAGASLATCIIVQVALVWLIRSLFSYSRLAEAGLDLGLTLLALSLAIFAAVRTESIFLAAWSFVLVQAFRVSIPGLALRWSEPAASDLPGGDPNRGFEDALKAADEALHRIAGRG